MTERITFREYRRTARNTYPHIYPRARLVLIAADPGGQITPELVYRATGKTEADRPGLFAAIVRHLEARWMIDEYHRLTGLGDAYRRLSANRISERGPHGA